MKKIAAIGRTRRMKRSREDGVGEEIAREMKCYALTFKELKAKLKKYSKEELKQVERLTLSMAGLTDEILKELVTELKTLKGLKELELFLNREGKYEEMDGGARFRHRVGVGPYEHIPEDRIGMGFENRNSYTVDGIRAVCESGLPIVGLDVSMPYGYGIDSVGEDHIDVVIGEIMASRLPLRWLIVMSGSVSDRGVESIVNSGKPLEWLELIGSSFPIESATKIASSRLPLKFLKIGKTLDGQIYGDEFGEALARNNRTLEYLDVGYFKVSDKVIEMIMKSGMKLRGVKEIGRSVTDEGIRAIARSGQPIEYLELATNLTGAGARELMESALPLRSLVIRGNHKWDYSEAAAEIFGSNRKLEYLEWALTFLPGASLRGIGRNGFRVEELSLSGGNIGAEGVSHLVGSGVGVKRLDLSIALRGEVKKAFEYLAESGLPLEYLDAGFNGDDTYQFVPILVRSKLPLKKIWLAGDIWRKKKDRDAYERLQRECQAQGIVLDGMGV